MYSERCISAEDKETRKIKREVFFFFFPACSLSPPGGDREECGGRDRSIFLFFKGHLFLVSVSVDSFSKHLRARSFFFYSR